MHQLLLHPNALHFVPHSLYIPIINSIYHSFDPVCNGDSDLCGVRNWFLDIYYSDEILLAKCNPLKMKRKLLYLKTHFVPRIKHFLSQL
jgi:hypothetical protein